jgi:hypothetical protein
MDIDCGERFLAQSRSRTELPKGEPSVERKQENKTTEHGAGKVGLSLRNLVR